MAGSTPIYGIPYPESSDLVANYPAVGEQLAETLDEKLPTYAGTAPTSPSVGQIWIDSADDTPNFWDGGAWVPFPSGVGAADFSNTATGTYSSGGINYKYITFTGSGTLTITTEGYADVWILSGGSPDFAAAWNGGAGGLLRGPRFFAAGAYTVTVGGSATKSSVGSYIAQICNLWTGLGATNNTSPTGLYDSITGTSLLYGRGAQVSPVVNRGEGRSTSAPGPGSSGVVVIRVEV